MKLKCPACGAPISADSINVQTMTAVCPECDNVFTFDPVNLQPDRKVKPPKQITFYDDAPMHFSFKWDWRTEPLVGLASAGFLLVFPALIEGVGIVAFLLMLPVLYVVLTLFMNSTHYKIEGDFLHVYTEPLWYPAYGTKRILLADISEIVVQKMLKTPSISQFDTFHDVYARLKDGKEIMIARLVNTPHAHFIAQEIESALDLQHDRQGDTFRQRLVDEDTSEVDRGEPQSSKLSAHH